MIREQNGPYIKLKSLLLVCVLAFITYFMDKRVALAFLFNFDIQKEYVLDMGWVVWQKLNSMFCQLIVLLFLFHRFFIESVPSYNIPDNIPFI